MTIRHVFHRVLNFDVLLISQSWTCKNVTSKAKIAQGARAFLLPGSLELTAQRLGNEYSTPAENPTAERIPHPVRSSLCLD